MGESKDGFCAHAASPRWVLWAVAFAAATLFLVPSAAAADVGVDTSGALATIAQSHAAWGPIWTSTTTGYIVYLDSGADVTYKKTTDGGVTWASAIDVYAGTVEKVAVWYDAWTPGVAGGIIHIAHLETDGTDEVRYESINTAASDALSASVTVAAPGTFNTNDATTEVSITKARGGNLYVGYQYSNVATSSGFYRSTNAGATFAARTSTGFVDVTNSYFRLFPGSAADVQDVWALFWDRIGSELELKVHDDSANSWATTSISTGMSNPATTCPCYLQMSGAVRASDNHLIVAAWNALDPTTLSADLKVWDVNGASSIVALSDVISNQDDTAQAAVFIDQRTDELYVAYLGNSNNTWPTSTGVHYKKSTDGGATWATESNLNENAAAGNDWIDAGHSSGSSGGRFRPLWFDDTGDDLLVPSTASSVYLGPAVTLSLSGSPQAEASGVATVTATIPAAASLDTSVNLAFEGTATLTSDYTRSQTSITISAGATAATGTLTAVPDTLDEAAETIIVDISSVTNGIESGTQQVTATITDDDATPTVTLSVAGSPVAEAAGAATVTATLSAASGLDVTVNLDFAGTGVVADDYTRSGTNISIPAAAMSGIVTLTAVQDVIDEAAETIIVDISSVTNGIESGTQQVTATITDDDATPTVTLSLSGSPLAEAAGAATLTATLGAASGLDVTVNLAFSGGATTTADYTTSASSIVIPAGATTGTATVAAVPDTIDETAETIVVDVSTVNNALESGTQQVTASITDDDAPPTVTLSLSGSPAAEAAGAATLTATLSTASGLDVTVDLAFGGTATPTSDYTGSGTSILVAAGATSNSITLTAVQDTAAEFDETIVADVSAVSNGSESGTQQVTATISDDEASATLAVADVTLNEGNAGTTAFSFAVVLTPAAGTTVATTVTVAYSTSDVSAIVTDSDYAAASGTLTFAPGNSTQTVTVLVAGETRFESTETFVLNLASATGRATIADAQAIGTILNDEATPSFSIDDPSAVLEGNSGTASVDFTVTLTAAAGTTIGTTVDVTASSGDGTATSAGSSTTGGNDYAPRSGAVISFPPGTSTQTFSIQVSGDTAYELAESFAVNLANPTSGAGLSDAQGLALITNDEAAPSLSINDPSPITEANAATTPVAFTVTLAPSTGTTMGVALAVTAATGDGTATTAGTSGAGGSDYVARTGVDVSFPVGTLTQPISVTVNGDTAYETDETFVVDLSNPTNGAALADAQGTGTVSNDEAAPSFSINDAAITEGASGTANLAFVVTLAPATGTTLGTAISLTASTADGTATAAGTSSTGGNDYQARTNTALAFPVGTLTQPFTVLANGDSAYEASETVLVNLAGATAGALLADAQGVGTVNNDEAAPTFSINDPGTVAEGNGGTAPLEFTLTLSPAAGTTMGIAVAVNAATGDGTATASGVSSTGGNDYVPRAGTAVTFPVGTLTQSFAVSVNGDSAYELAETLVVNLAGPTQEAVLGDAQGVGTVGNDEAAPRFAVADPAPIAEGNAGASRVDFTVSLTPAAGTTLGLSVSVTAASADSTATTAGSSASGGNDYVPIASTVLDFAVGTSSRTLSTDVNGDAAFETDEDFFLDLSGATQGALVQDGQARATLSNDDAAPSFSVDDPTITEGTGAPSALTFTVTLSAPAGLSSTVQFATQDATATTAGADYSAQVGLLTFEAGSDRKTVSVAATADAIDEPDETLRFLLRSPTGGLTIGDAEGIGTLLDDDLPSVTVTALDATASEPGTDTGTFRFTRTTGELGTALLLRYAVSGSGQNGTDYESLSGVLEFAVGESTGTVLVRPLDDALAEGAETVRVTLSASASYILEAPATAQVALNDDEPVPGIRLAPAEGVEGDVGTVSVTLTLELDFASDAAIEVRYGTQDATAIAGDDFQSLNGTLTIAAGELAASLDVFLIGDATDEDDELFILELLEATGANLVDTEGTVTIRDDDAAPTLGIGNVTQDPEGDTGSQDAVFVATLSAASGKVVEVSYAVEAGSADDGLDFISSASLLTFAPGTTEQEVRVPVLGDTIDEPTEDFTVQLSGAVNAGLSEARATGTIVDDDAPEAVGDGPFQISEDATATSLDVLGNDRFSLEPGESVVVVGLVQGAKGLAAIADGGARVTYQPFANATGADAFTYTLQDGEGDTSTATVEVDILSAPDAPDARDDVSATPEDIPFTVSLVANDVDGDGDALAVTVLEEPSHGTVVVNAGGTITYTPRANFHGVDTFDYSATDGSFASGTATVTITVGAVNDAPAIEQNGFNGIVLWANETATHTFGVADPDLETDAGESHSFQVTTSGLGSANVTGGVLSLAMTTPGSENLTLTLTDAAGATDTFLVRVRVNADGGIGSNARTPHGNLTVGQAEGAHLDPNEADTDGDGVPDDRELGDPGDPTDSDGDGIIDALELGAAADDSTSLSFMVPAPTAGALGLTQLAGRAIEISTSTGAIAAAITPASGLPILAETDAGTLDPTADYPFGLYSFRVTVAPGGSAVVTLRLPTGIVIPSGAQYRKLSASDTWDIFPAAVIDAGTGTVTLTLTDGAAGDRDGVADGVITDPGGIAVATASGGSGGGGGGGGSPAATITPTPVPTRPPTSASVAPSSTPVVPIPTLVSPAPTPLDAGETDQSLVALPDDGFPLGRILTAGLLAIGAGVVAARPRLIRRGYQVSVRGARAARRSIRRSARILHGVATEGVGQAANVSRRTARRIQDVGASSARLLAKASYVVSSRGLALLRASRASARELRLRASRAASAMASRRTMRSRPQEPTARMSDSELARKLGLARAPESSAIHDLLEELQRSPPAPTARPAPASRPPPPAPPSAVARPVSSPSPPAAPAEEEAEAPAQKAAERFHRTLRETFENVEVVRPRGRIEGDLSATVSEGLHTLAARLPVRKQLEKGAEVVENAHPPVPESRLDANADDEPYVWGDLVATLNHRTSAKRGRAESDTGHEEGAASKRF